MSDTFIGTTMSTSINICRLVENRLQSSNIDLDFVLDIDPDASPVLQKEKLGLMRKWIDEILKHCMGRSQTQ